MGITGKKVCTYSTTSLWRKRSCKVREGISEGSTEHTAANLPHTMASTGFSLTPFRSNGKDKPFKEGFPVTQ
jgi:hypothetical protein